MDTAAVLPEFADTPAGRQAKWYVGVFLSAGDGARATDRDHYTPQVAKRLNLSDSDEHEREAWRSFAARMGPVVSIALTSASEFRVELSFAFAKDRRWRLLIEVEEQPPHRICQANWQRQFDFKLDVREATEADARMLADIERRCPIVLGDTRVHFDRGEDYFAFVRLMEDCTIGIASVDGVPAAVSCGTKNRVRIGGVDRWIVTVSHLRVLPEHQRRGLWGAANRVLEKYWSNVDGSNAYISVDNAGMQHGFINTPNKWSIVVQCAKLSCATMPGPVAGRPAVAADAPAIVELLNSFRGREEMYLPYTVESLRARLERAPRQYSWDKIRMTERAVVGVWPAGDSLKVVSETGGRRSESRRGLVLDYAFISGAEDEFEAIVRGWCGWLAERQIDTLLIFTSPTSPGSDRVRSLASQVEEFNMWTPGIPEPPEAKHRGLYVDPIYF